MFYDRFKQLCDEKGVSCNKAALEIGLSNATVTKWKKTGATPKGETLAKIAEYFMISVDYLLSPHFGNPKSIAYKARHTKWKSALSEEDIQWMMHDKDIGAVRNPDGSISIPLSNLEHIAFEEDMSIQDMLNVNDDYAVTLRYETKKASTSNGERTVSDAELKFALWGSSDIDDEDLEDVRRYAAFVKERKKAKK